MTASSLEMTKTLRTASVKREIRGEFDALISAGVNEFPKRDCRERQLQRIQSITVQLSAVCMHSPESLYPAVTYRKTYLLRITTRGPSLDALSIAISNYIATKTSFFDDFPATTTHNLYYLSVSMAFTTIELFRIGFTKSTSVTITGSPTSLFE